MGGPSRRQRRLLTHPPIRPFPQSAAARVPGSGAARAPCRHHALPHTGPLAIRRNLNSLDAARLHQLSSLRRAICFRLCERELQVCDPPRWGTPHQQHEKEWLPFPQGLQLAQPPPPPARRGWPTPRRPAPVNTTESWWSVAAPAGLQWPARSERAFRARLASLSRAVPTGEACPGSWAVAALGTAAQADGGAEDPWRLPLHVLVHFARLPVALIALKSGVLQVPAAVDPCRRWGEAPVREPPFDGKRHAGRRQVGQGSV